MPSHNLSCRLCAVCIGFTLALEAQTSRGSVTGFVADAQQAATPNAKIELTGLLTNTSRVTQTNAAGLYRFDAVDPGVYKLTVQLPGFRTTSTPSLRVNAGRETIQDAVLEIGEAQQIIEVRSASLAPQRESPGRGGVIDGADIAALPYASRNPVDLGLTLPGVTSTKFATPTATFVVNGARGRSNNFMVDGAGNNDISVAGQAFPLRNPEAVQEVSVQTSNYDAEYGHAGGAVVNLITRSGTNALHGGAGFLLDSTRDDAISSSLSRDPSIQARGKNLPGTEQQFDGTLGGPIVRNQTFFFLSYLEVRQFSTSTTDMISPTSSGRADLLRLFPAGQNANADLLQTITTGYDGNTLPFLVPLGAGRPSIEFGHIITPYSQSLRTRQYGVKLDHRLGSRDLLSGRLLVDSQRAPKGGANLNFPSFVTGDTQNTETIALYYTHLFSPSVTNELRPGFTRFNLDFPLDASNPLAKTLPQISIAGFSTPYGIPSSVPQGRVFNNYVLQDTVTFLHGSHTIRAGFDLTKERARQAAVPFNERGTLTYGASSPAGGVSYSALANFLDDFGGAGSAVRSFGALYYYPEPLSQSYFLQDRWRASQALTLTLGLRYENFGLPMNVTTNPVFTGLFTVDPVTLDSPLAHPNKVNPDNNNWSPALGVAYSPGNRKFVLRAGYTIGYDSYFNNITSNIMAAAPASLTATVTSQVSAANPRGVAGLSKSIPSTPPAVTPFLTQFAVAKDLRNPYYQHWSAGVQRELPSGFLLDVAYVGTKGTRLYVTEDANPLVTPELRAPVPANTSTATRQSRVDQLQGARTIRTNGASSIYHAAQVELKRRFANGFNLNGSYTFSKEIDNASEIFSYGNTSTLQSAAVPALFGGQQLDRGVGFFDRTHRLVFSYVYELPFGKSQHGVIGRALGGWRVSGLTTFESGVPYSVLNGQDTDGLGGSAFDRPNFNPSGDPGVRAVPSASSPTGYINPDNGNAPIDPLRARYIGIAANPGIRRTPSGNLGRDTERGPGLKNWDLAIAKTTAINERLSLEFRAELYNVWNTPMHGKVSVSPFAVPQNSQTISANVFTSPAGQFLNETLQDGGGRVIRWQLRMRF